MFTRDRRRRRRRRVAVGAAVVVLGLAGAAGGWWLTSTDDGRDARGRLLASDEAARLAGDGSSDLPEPSPSAGEGLGADTAVASGGGVPTGDTSTSEAPTGEAPTDDRPDASDGPTDTNPTIDTGTPSDPATAPLPVGRPAPDGQWLPAQPEPSLEQLDRPELVRLLRSYVDLPELQPAAGTVRVAVVDQDGDELLSIDGDDPGLPASTNKVVTAAAVLQAFGPDHVLTTTVEATAPLDEDGVLRGDLVVVGDGDPVLATPLYGRNVYPQRPRTPIEALADQLVDAGLTRVEGRFVADPRVLSRERFPDGWKDDYLLDLNGRAIRGLTVDAGIVIVPPSDEEAPERILAEELGRDFLVDVEGLDEAPRLLAEQPDDPARHTVEVLRVLLEDRGVALDTARTAVVGDTLVRNPAEAVEQLASVDSPPMDVLVRHMLERSDNQLADTLVRLAGTQDVGLEPAGNGSFDDGEDAGLAMLRWLGLDPVLDDVDGELRVADGSGLSRDDRLTARVLAHLDRAMADSQGAATWNDTMARAGVEGTIRRRMRGTAAEGLFVAKSGTLDDVRAMVGAVHGRDGQRYHLAVVADGLENPVVVSQLIDRLAVTLALDLGCRPPPGVPPIPPDPDDPDGTPTPPPDPGDPDRGGCAITQGSDSAQTDG